MASSHPSKDFTTRLFQDTREMHSAVDKHPFVKAMREVSERGHDYVRFNEVCVLYLQRTLSLPKDLKQRLHRSVASSEEEYTDLQQRSPSIHILLERCERYPLEHAYMFYLGLLKGGRILSRFVDLGCLAYDKDDADDTLVDDFKAYLDFTITSESSQTAFINIVKDSYEIIAKCFDEFFSA